MERTELGKRVAEAVGALEPAIVATISELVRIPSVVGSEAQAQACVEDLYRRHGLEVTTLEADPELLRGHPAFINTGQAYHGRPNVLGVLPGPAGGPSLILNGHIDVVSPAPAEAWARDPWGGQVEGDRLYGRGAGDMKAGLVANLFALAALKKAGLAPAGRVELHSVVDEEAGGAGGTLACLAAGHRAEAMICTEPHALNVTFTSVGINYFKVRVQGLTAHAGLAHNGINAIGKMIPIYQALVALDEQRGRTIRVPSLEAGSGRSCHLNVGTMSAGDWPSTVAGSAEIQCRIGFVPGETQEEIKRLVERTVAQASEADPWLREHPPQVEWFGWHSDPWRQDPDHRLVACARQALEDVTGRPPEVIGRASGNDARFAQYYGMAALCTGPKAGNIHGIDEYVEIPSVLLLTRALALTVLDWCGCA